MEGLQDLQLGFEDGENGGEFLLQVAKGGLMAAVEGCFDEGGFEGEEDVGVDLGDGGRSRGGSGRVLAGLRDEIWTELLHY